MRRTMLVCGLLAWATALPTSADEGDLAHLQGKWQRLSKDTDGKTIRIEKEHKGHTTNFTVFDETGRVTYSHTSEFELSRTDKIRIFTYFNLVIVTGPSRGPIGEDRKSYIYRVEGDQFVEVQGLLIGQEKEEPMLIIWDRVKE